MIDIERQILKNQRRLLAFVAHEYLKKGIPDESSIVQNAMTVIGETDDLLAENPYENAIDRVINGNTTAKTRHITNVRFDK